VIKDTKKIFDEYYRENKYNDGFGLGLNLVKSICDEQRVGITLESNEEITKFRYRFRLENTAS
jgi:K+-sensing histidine kinase KdpD